MKHSQYGKYLANNEANNVDFIPWKYGHIIKKQE